ncbi:hypothetical protein ROLI_038790 [Roseobacter fucihabitans]|uniref:Uncharacterized protein n=1 Tax=Roseobacter fucihabitans TaxID=1537242 RepID=A0ABZ2BXN6_9RHOB|nr:hypothetical protein [Roseobacter litoralis]
MGIDVHALIEIYAFSVSESLFNADPKVTPNQRLTKGWGLWTIYFE